MGADYDKGAGAAVSAMLLLSPADLDAMRAAIKAGLTPLAALEKVLGK